MNDPIQQAHALVTAEIDKLTQIKASLEQAIALRGSGAVPAVLPSMSNGHALPGGLREAIRKLKPVLPKTFRKRDVIGSLKSQGYPFSLSPNYVAKTMGRMVEDKILAIDGDRTKATYRFR